MVQQPGALIQFVVFAVLVWVLAHERLLVGGILANRHLPAEVAHLGAMLAQWFLAVLLVLYAGIPGSALAYWAVAMASRTLPAVTTSLGLLAKKPRTARPRPCWRRFTTGTVERASERGLGKPCLRTETRG